MSRCIRWQDRSLVELVSTFNAVPKASLLPSATMVIKDLCGMLKVTVSETFLAERFAFFGGNYGPEHIESL